MLKIIKTLPEHLHNMEFQKAQYFCKEQFLQHPEYIEALANDVNTYTGINKDGKVIGIMGMTLRHSNCGEGWAIFSPEIKEHIFSVVKGVKAFLQKNKHVKRIHCTASVNFPEAHKLLKVFGFKVEGILEAWDVLGTDHIMYVIINNSIDWELR